MTCDALINEDIFSSRMLNKVKQCSMTIDSLNLDILCDKLNLLNYRDKEKFYLEYYGEIVTNHEKYLPLSPDYHTGLIITQKRGEYLFSLSKKDMVKWRIPYRRKVSAKES